MRILAYIKKIERDDEFFVITAQDVRKCYHTLYFKEDKWKQIKNEYGSNDLLGLACILEYAKSGKISGFIQTDTKNKPIFTDKDRNIS